jgi:hypothetical protein
MLYRFISEEFIVFSEGDTRIERVIPPIPTDIADERRNNKTTPTANPF